MLQYNKVIAPVIEYFINILTPKTKNTWVTQFKKNCIYVNLVFICCTVLHVYTRNILKC